MGLNGKTQPAQSGLVRGFPSGHPSPRPVVIKSNPKTVSQSPVPWQVSTIIMMASGVGVWCLSSRLQMPEMGEAARLMVYLPLGNIFGMSLAARNSKVVGE